MELIDKLERTQDLVIALMDKKERLEATRHARLVACLEDVNRALGTIFRRLTSVEGKGASCSMSNCLIENSKRSAPRGNFMDRDGVAAKKNMDHPRPSVSEARVIYLKQNKYVVVGEANMEGTY